MGSVVDLSSVHLGMRVARGRDWRSGRKGWRSDVAGGRRFLGTVIGFISEHGQLVGENTRGRHFDRFYLDDTGRANVGPGWCAVRWDNDKESIYPIGSNLFLGNWWKQQEVAKGAKAFALEHVRD